MPAFYDILSKLISLVITTAAALNSSANFLSKLRKQKSKHATDICNYTLTVNLNETN